MKDSIFTNKSSINNSESDNDSIRDNGSDSSGDSYDINKGNCGEIIYSLVFSFLSVILSIFFLFPLAILSLLFQYELLNLSYYHWMIII